MIKKIIFSLFLVLIVIITPLEADIPQSERDALIALYNSTNGDSWTDNSGWKTPPLHSDGFALPGTEGTWSGVTVNSDHVTRLIFLNKNLTGSIPAAIGDLGNLTLINMSNNHLSGTIPPQFFTLSALTSLTLNSNTFSNLTLSDFLPLTNLSNLEMNSCGISGSIPSTINNLSKLSYFLVNNNSISGSLPPELGDLSDLSYLSLSGNNLTGAIPAVLGTLNDLTTLNLGNNSLSGTLPTELGNLSNLSTLRVSYNHISGTLPSSLGSLTQLTLLDISNNQFYGSVPTTFGNLTNLKFANLDNNSLSGPLPSQLGDMTALIFLYLNSNSLMSSIPPELGNLPNLTILDLSFNYFSGSIPPELGNLPKIRELNLKSNELTGTIPPELGNLTTIQKLYLSRNRLNGNIPEALCTLNSLQYFYLGANNFVGPVPASVMNLSGLYYIELSNNGFYTFNSALDSFLDVKSPFWKTTQTIAPTGISCSALSTSSVTLNWTPIEYTSGTGCYRVYASTTSGGSYTFFTETADKSASSTTITGLNPDTTYYFVIQTKTASSANNKNVVYSDYSEEISVKTLTGVSQYTLAVQSSPSTGVSITVSPNDTNGQGNGTTNFTRIYNSGTNVTLTAPTTYNSNNFSRWKIDGVGNSSRTISVTMDQDHTVQAVYESSTYTLTVRSSPDTGSAITVSPNDNNGHGNGSTNFTRTYNNGTNVNLTAPATNNGKNFSRWSVDGIDYANTGIQVAMTGDVTATAYFVTYSSPVIALNRASLNYCFIDGVNKTGSQAIMVSNTGGSTLNWSAASTESWIILTPSSASGSGIITVSIEPTGLSVGNYSGSIDVTDANAANSPQSVTVNLIVKNAPEDQLPFGQFATPLDGSSVSSSVPVTGWVLDDVEVKSVKLFRVDGSTLSYIGDAVFVDGARPDVETAYPDYPKNYQAGWGYMLLTNFLPPDGNGVFTLHAVATDTGGHETTLGIRTITVDNANAVKPFGAIDTPAQGGSAAGASFRNHGWVLTPMPNSIPVSGSTIDVYIDGVKLGHPVYNVYRSDIAAFFPGYANSDGAAGYFDIDTTEYANGVHSISWTAVDSAGNADGIGSRYFSIQNTASGSRSKSSLVNSLWPHGKNNLSLIPLDKWSPVSTKKGFNPNAEPLDIYPNDSGIITVEIRELEPIEISVGVRPTQAGYAMPLPIGSTFRDGIFYWIPGPGFIGDYPLVFIIRNPDGELRKREMVIRIKARISG